MSAPVSRFKVPIRVTQAHLGFENQASLVFSLSEADDQLLISLDLVPTQQMDDPLVIEKGDRKRLAGACLRHGRNPFLARRHLQHVQPCGDLLRSLLGGVCTQGLPSQLLEQLTCRLIQYLLANLATAFCTSSCSRRSVNRSTSSTRVVPS